MGNMIEVGVGGISIDGWYVVINYLINTEYEGIAENDVKDGVEGYDEVDLVDLDVMNCCIK